LAILSFPTNFYQKLQRPLCPHDRAHKLNNSTGNIVAIDTVEESIPPDTDVENTLLNPMSLELKQFDRFTSATFSGSAKTMSTHCIIPC
jgi:hypothetical protein